LGVLNEKQTEIEQFEQTFFMFLGFLTTFDNGLAGLRKISEGLYDASFFSFFKMVIKLN
jgi:hypothetical protein